MMRHKLLSLAGRLSQRENSPKLLRSYGGIEWICCED